MYEKCRKNILRSMFFFFCYIKKDQLILSASRTCIYRLEHICRVRAKMFKSLYTCNKSKRPALEPTLHVYIIRRREIMVRISRRSIGPVRIQDIICLEEVYPFDIYILLNKYVLNISYTWEIM